MGAGAITLACLMLAAQTGDADVCHIKDYNFTIPIKLASNNPSEIRKLKLFKSLDEGRTWTLHEVATPDKKEFSYLATQDGKAREGIYWFTVVVEYTRDPVDIPAPDLKGVPVSLKVLVDCTPPDVRVDAHRDGDAVVVRWGIKEDYPDPKTFKVEYRSTDMPVDKWKLVPEAKAGPTGEISFKPGSGAPVTVRVSVMDKAENLGSRTVEVGGTGHGSGQAIAAEIQPPPMSPLTPPLMTPDGHLPELAGGYGALPPIGPNNQVVPMPISPLQNNVLDTSHPGSQTNTITQTGATQPVPNQVPSAVPVPGLPPVQYVNKPSLKLEFEVAKVGPSGLGCVDVYQTLDDGRTWEKCPVSPADVVLPLIVEGQKDPAPHGTVTVQLTREEVIYGFCLVVKNGALNGRNAPQPGLDVPQVRVELDSRPPEAHLLKSRNPHPTRHDVVVLSWKAMDRNLTATPITLEWSDRPDGGWNFIGAPELPNIPSQIEWQVPAHMPPKIYLRLTVRDLAGNVEVQQTNEPQLIDLSVPEARIVGINPAGPHTP